MSHGQDVGDSDFTFLASYRGKLFAWLGGRVAEWDGGDERTKHGPEGIACYGGCISGAWLTVAIRTRPAAAHGGLPGLDTLPDELDAVPGDAGYPLAGCRPRR